jgi:N5-(cytidine 5'-diphosphoramidyl)-L-glutamine hydrolase
VKLVAISQRIDFISLRDETRDALDQRLVGFVQAAGYLAVTIPNCAGDLLYEWMSRVQPDALILSGGNDIGDCPDRDRTEYSLVDMASHLRLPVLGICRGLQVLALWSGASLKAVSGHCNARHKLVGHFSNDVNSYHNFSISHCPDNFLILAKSDDGEIEAIKHRSLPWEGWMWHPERETSFSSHDINRLKELFL